jgi:hypothetical protein
MTKPLPGIRRSCAYSSRSFEESRDAEKVAIIRKIGESGFFIS